MKLEFTYDPNANGRIYKREVFEAALLDYMDKVKHNNALGELGQDIRPDVVSLNNCSHVIRDIEKRNKKLPRKLKKQYKKDGRWEEWKRHSRTLKLKIEILDTPSGNIAKSLIKRGSLPNIGIRGVGVVSESGEVDDNFNILSFDLLD